MKLSVRTPYALLILLSAFTIVFSCKKNSKKELVEPKVDKTHNSIIEVVTTGMEFDLVDEIDSGWTTFKYINNSYEPHFFVFEKMPDSIGYEEYTNQLLPPFKNAFELLGKGDFEAGMKEFENIPAWFAEVKLSGGVGMTSGRSTTESTIFMEPGTYIMECYVRMPNGIPHTFMGMYKELIVRNTMNEIQEPEFDLGIDLSSEGISFKDSLEVGSYNFKVNFTNQIQYEHFMGHDLNLVRIDNDSLIPILGKWLNANDMTSLRTPAPVGLTFLGGVEDLGSGSYGFFKTTLDKGDYVLISEIPNAIERNMFKTFKVY